MDLLPLVFVQWLHILAGVVWMGGSVIFALVVYPMLFERPKDDARAMYEHMAKPMGVLMAVCGNLTPLLGLLRATVMGPIKSLAQLWETSYGVTFCVAFALSAFLAAHGARTSDRIPALLEGEGVISKAVGRSLMRDAWVSVFGFVLVLTCMVLMRFGL